MLAPRTPLSPSPLLVQPLLAGSPPVAVRRLVALLALGGGLAGPAAGQDADGEPGCAGLRGGELVLSASARCVGRLRGDTTLRREIASSIQAQVGGGAAAGGSTAAAGTPPARGQPQGLSHPLARLSMLNAQSRYLWSLSNGVTPYYGQGAGR